MTAVHVKHCSRGSGQVDDVGGRRSLGRLLLLLACKALGEETDEPGLTGVSGSRIVLSLICQHALCSARFV